MHSCFSSHRLARDIIANTQDIWFVYTKDSCGGVQGLRWRHAAGQGEVAAASGAAAVTKRRRYTQTVSLLCISVSLGYAVEARLPAFAMCWPNVCHGMWKIYLPCHVPLPPCIFPARCESAWSWNRNQNRSCFWTSTLTSQGKRKSNADIPLVFVCVCVCVCSRPVRILLPHFYFRYKFHTLFMFEPARRANS